MFKLFILSFSVLILPIGAFSEWFAPQTMQNTVLLEKVDNDNFVPFGTGFLLYNYKTPEKLIVTTCSHLIQNKSQICVRVNTDSSLVNIFEKIKVKSLVLPEKKCIIYKNSVRFIIQFTDFPQKNYILHDSLDIGVFIIEIPKLIYTQDTLKTEIKITDLLTIPRSFIVYK